MIVDNYQLKVKRDSIIFNFRLKIEEKKPLKGDQILIIPARAGITIPQHPPSLKLWRGRQVWGLNNGGVLVFRFLTADYTDDTDFKVKIYS